MWIFNSLSSSPCKHRKIIGIILLVCILLLQSDVTDYSPSRTSLAPYVFSIETWVGRNLVSKFRYKLEKAFLNRNVDVSKSPSLVTEFFQINQQINARNRELDRISLNDEGRVNRDYGIEVERSDQPEFSSEISRLHKARNLVQEQVEAIVEESIEVVLQEQGFGLSIGGINFVFPPVALRFDTPPFILIVSPRNKITVLESVILRQDLTNVQIQELEDDLLLRRDVSVWVGQIGGLATYPSIIPYASQSYIGFRTGAHEWLHQYWFFHPLGRNYFRSSEMTTLNETAADLAGNELGRWAMKVVDVEEKIVASTTPTAEINRFDFYREMHSTRLSVEVLLTEGKVVEAEEYMESRRKIFVVNGYNIRKLNQAYFAFHGIYAESPASVSPIAEQLYFLRNNSSDLGEFIRIVGEFGSHSEFLEYLKELE